MKPLPHIVRLFMLDEGLRQRTGGQRDISARPEELATLDLPISRVCIVENLQTGLAFEDHPGSVVLMGLGYGVGTLARLRSPVPPTCEPIRSLRRILELRR